MSPGMDPSLLAQITIKEEESKEEDSYPKPGKSTVLCEVIEGDNYMFRRWSGGLTKHVELELDFGELQHEGGSAAIEAEAGMLDYAVAPMLLDSFDELKPGWYVVEGFYGSYSTDYYGEVDCDFDCDLVRKARWSDIEHFGVARAPWWARLLRLFGKDVHR